MKLNKLTSAVSISLAALVLTACGNDNNTPNTNSQNIVNDNQAQIDQAIKEAEKARQEAEKARQEAEKAKAEAEKAKAEAEQAKENIAKENNPVAEIAEINSTIKSFDVTKKPSVGGANYIRSEASSFDRASNPLLAGSNIVAYSDTLQDKKLSNFVAASQSFTGADGRTRIYKNVLGATESQPGLKNNLIYGGIYGSGATGTTIQDANVNNVTIAVNGFTAYSAKDVLDTIKTDTTVADSSDLLSFFNSEHAPLVQKIITEAVANPSGDVTIRRPLEQKVLYLAGIDDKFYIPNGPKPLVDYLNFVYDKSDLSKSGLIITQVDDRNESDYAKPEGLVVNRQDAQDARDGRINNDPTRVFGRAFNNTDLMTTEPNTYQASYNANDKFVALTPAKLNNVQYGRLTSTLDAINQPIDPANINKQYVARNLTTRDTNKSVDYYFYRGTDATSIADMAKVKAKGVDINYQGHALVYGRDTVSGASNAVGGTPTFGNFVQATYKTATGDVNGSIYNFSVPTDAVTKADITKNDLISFNGKVNGNTVEGSAIRLVDSNPGSFIGSFYGRNANELGGAINSVNQNNPYGDTKWGAVFGAKSADVVADVIQTVE